jgi:hypothetical protein
MAEIYHLDIHITDDMTTSEEVDLLKQLSKASQMLAAVSMMRNKRTIATQSMQALLNGAVHLDVASNIWNGPSPLSVPQLQVPSRPI